VDGANQATVVVLSVQLGAEEEERKHHCKQGTGQKFNFPHEPEIHGQALQFDKSPRMVG
jgi:hypothetical protein